MTRIFPLRPYRYTQQAGDLSKLVTQPYDKISPSMQAGYLESSPHNLVRIILGERFPTDTDTDNVYTRAAAYFQDWIARGILAQDPEPAFYAYVQEFRLPDSEETLIRKGFIGLGPVEEYEKQIVHRHEQTLSGPKKDRRLVLEHTKAHFGQIFMLYPDPQLQIDAILDDAAKGTPAAAVRDEYDTLHTLYRISHPAAVQRIQELMSDKKLLIADGHHRYETALAYRNDHSESEDAKRVMMTFVNMHSPGLRILATHRVLTRLENFDRSAFLGRVCESFSVKTLPSVRALKAVFAESSPDSVRIGVAFAGEQALLLLERPRDGALDVRVLHEDLIEGALGISPEAVREEKFITYVRGIDAALQSGGQITFLLEPTTIQQVADTSFGGGVMPQKSTDFYPKLLTGLTIYRLEK